MKYYITILLFILPCLFAQEKEVADWFVQIKLKSGSSLNGVIKNGIFVEKKDLQVHIKHLQIRILK